MTSDMANPPGPRIFVGSAVADQAWVQWLRLTLSDSDVTVLAAGDEDPGDSWLEHSAAARSSSAEFWAVLSEAFAESDAAREELLAARAQGQRIVGLIVDDVGAELAPMASSRIDLRKGTLDRLEGRVRRTAVPSVRVESRSPRSARTADPEPLAFVNRRTLGERLPPTSPPPDAVPRIAVVEALHRALHPNVYPNIVFLSGPAGSGKTVAAQQYVAGDRDAWSDVGWGTLPQVRRVARELWADRDIARPSDPVLMVVDGIDSEKDVLGVIRLFTRLPDWVVVLMVGRAEPVPEHDQRIASVVKMPTAMTDAELSELATRFAEDLDATQIDRVLAASRGLPVFVSAFSESARTQGAVETVHVLDALTQLGDVDDGLYYLDTDDPRVIAQWERNFQRLVGPEIVLSEFRRGSWFRRWLRSDGASELADKAGRAAEVAALARPESEANLNNAEAIAKLMEASAQVDDFVAISGSILLVKAVVDGRPRVFTRTLTATQLRAFERDHQLASNPAAVLEFLDRAPQVEALPPGPPTA